MALLDVKGLTKTFGGLVAVNNIDFQMEDKQIVSVIGPNGAGKTTFFNVISGYYPDHVGTITFGGHNLKDLNPEKVAAYRMARTFQNIRLFPDMLTVENILVGMHLHLSSNLFDIVLNTKRLKREEKEAYERAMELLNYVGLEGKDNELAKNLPYGEQRLLEIARALAIKPKLLLLDEPAAGLNPKETEAMKNFIIKIRDELGHSILLIEHDMKLVMGLSDKITVINYGVKIAEGTPDEIKNNPEVIKAYLGDDTTTDAVA
ncbi:amino acid/amide ABC transporter ATP-binding protein 1, HAAT family [Anaerovirgula multivorans]|uniref:Amino acid/amide ABC transporter ATP-binding protein 1, HAAT family n=1 Tax=Anaerovirgula multivorans TaxID=312168 RepID=A0A239D6D6_9FIRM|nr:ABC transporter ATP-binding protein [Anaerovirgula multivorans]SNS27847.1 amino acid/amide ABC transporter ATP-binding protein 1, HAAT family [Anaerovirgula multivorans]